MGRLGHPNLHVTSNTVPSGKEISEVFAMVLSSERIGTGHDTAPTEMNLLALARKR